MFNDKPKKAAWWNCEVNTEVHIFLIKQWFEMIMMLKGLKKVVPNNRSFLFFSFFYQFNIGLLISRSFIWSFFLNFKEMKYAIQILRNFHKFFWTQHSVCCIVLVISFMFLFQGGNFNIPIYLSFYIP